MVEMSWYIVFAAVALDFLFADPDWLPHPVVYMGNAISSFEKKFRERFENLLVSGIVFALFLIVVTWLISFWIIKLSALLHPVLGIIVQIVLLFFCFSAKSLEKAAMAVYQPLKDGNIVQARVMVGWIVGRQTESLDKNAVTRATIETVAENFVDGFLAPLFFACMGGVPLALAYKMVNTLDSMVGYKNSTYILFGRGAARIDDIANYIPARLSVLMIALSTAMINLKSGRRCFKTAVSQGRRHKSPNAGFPEAAFSGALKIRLGGPSKYHGAVVEKPFLGDAYTDPRVEKIRQACDLMLLSSLVSALFAGVILYVWN